MAFMNSKLKKCSVVLLSVLFVAAGGNHFVSPDVYRKIMPDYLPYPLALVYVSGFFEILGGVAVAVPILRTVAGWGLIALLIAVFPANLNMVIHAEDFPAIPFWALVLRLPLQGLLIAWVWWTTIAKQSGDYQDGRS